MMGQLKFPEGLAITGWEQARLFRRRERVLRFAGGRSRRKLEDIAKRMNASGEYVVAVKWMGKRQSDWLRQNKAQRAARKAMRRGE